MAANMEVKPILPPFATKQSDIRLFSPEFNKTALRNNMNLRTILLIGASLQAIIGLLPIPRIYVALPAILMLTAKIIDTALVTFNYKANPYLKNMMPKKTTAQPLDRNGDFSGAGKQKIAVLILGVKSNHPLGFFAPDFDKVGGYLKKMSDLLENDQTQESGFLGQSCLNKTDKNGANEFIFISYWRGLEDVHRFAHGELHREAWRWWESTLKQHNYIGFMHEVYEAPASSYEGVYINFQPSLLGATTYLKKDGKMVGGEVKPEWISPLVDANKGPMRTSNNRRGLKDRKDIVDEMFGERNAYEAVGTIGGSKAA
ncbi:uncharacterized protein PAC_11536 [Phialocephala subalpina]|uniref:Uncharacterized protein n=1 Tax=Phialocephala subalpina TaxID=576137 RepID=A0A1L7X9D6_9HELO|nr:uncharacterized protein PAC_11536 [Phialocephala subalpina]